jgi:hypothetical protein
MQCCHNDGNKENNRESNLRWDTPEGNTQDKVKHGTLRTGDRCYQASFDNSTVREMRLMFAGGVSRREIADRFQTSYDRVVLIIRGATYKDAGGPLAGKMKPGRPRIQGSKATEQT